MTVVTKPASNTTYLNVKRHTQKMKNEKSDVFINKVPTQLEEQFRTLITQGAIEFLVDLIGTFDDRVNDLYTNRLGRKYALKVQQRIPSFLTSEITKSAWKVAPVHNKLYNRHLDLGDVSPANLEHLVQALRAEVQGVQIDFDDGHCPTWANQINGLYNVYRIVHDQLENVPPLSAAPILMLRPRAWNMVEHNMSVNGKEVPGPLFDFSLLIYHNAKILSEHNVGPFFYLSKVEGASEAKLWNEIFTWTESKLQIPNGTIKACVLIENILSCFEMEHILYELKDHSLGLNCGIWDYAASIINKFGDIKSFILPDRNKYVNMSKSFLKRYMELVIQTCHKRGAHATGGMAADLLPLEADDEYETVIRRVCSTKLKEIQCGIDGFLVYDIKLVPHMNKLWKDYGGPIPNQIANWDPAFTIHELVLLTLPKGGVTKMGLRHNIIISILFIYYWLRGIGHFTYNGFIEDSATAEISRAQVWQWIRHSAILEDNDQAITRKLVHDYACEILKYLKIKCAINSEECVNLHIAHDIFLELVNHREFPDFITTYLNDKHVYRKINARL